MGLRSQFQYWLNHQVVKDDTSIWFGKHKGLKMSELPEDYRKWLKENSTYKNIQNYFKYENK